MPARHPRGRRTGAALASALVLLAGLALAGGGCQAIVGDAIPTFTCVGTSPSACPAGQFCKGSGCAPCERRDVCDTFDNDCNGKVDDGELSDRDGDGFTFCGFVDAVAGNKLVFDCDDNDKGIHPGAQELCNGKDDDCDGILDNPGTACPAGQTCAPKLGTCVDPSSLCSPENCPAPMLCDADTQQCVTPNAAKIGEACTTNRACETGICGDAATLTQAVANNGNFCTKPCCSSSECPRESVCYATGAGGNYCVPKAALKITTTLGTTDAGEACTSDTDCRSGSCEPSSKKCIDTCCVDANCKGGALCRFATSFRGKPSFACQTPGGSGDQSAPCKTNAECKGGLCHDYGIRTVGIFTYCVTPCCGSSRCGTVNLGFFGGGRQALVCTNGPVGAQGDVASTCSGEKQGSGTAALGAPCTQDQNCASELCLAIGDNTKRCTDVCCADADCQAVGWVCRPTSVQNKLYLRCVPN